MQPFSSQWAGLTWPPYNPNKVTLEGTPMFYFQVGEEQALFMRGSWQAPISLPIQLTWPLYIGTLERTPRWLLLFSSWSVASCIFWEVRAKLPTPAPVPLELKLQELACFRSIWEIPKAVKLGQLRKDFSCTALKFTLLKYLSQNNARGTLH